MKILVTGAKGFVGKNLCASLKSMEEYEVLEYDVNNSDEDLKRFCKECQFVVNLAGVNRPKNPKEFYEGNSAFIETLCHYLKIAENKAPILVSSSIQAERDNDYGKSKKAGEDFLIQYGKEENVRIYIYRFANLFGKWCRPNYNSVIATWCYNISHGLEIKINDDNAEISLCYIDDVVHEILMAISGNVAHTNIYCDINPVYKVTLKEIAEYLYAFKDSRENLYIPDMGNDFVKKLYSTYLNYLPVDEFSYNLDMHNDTRGSFTEFIKTKNFGQISVNVSKPGITKGNHWHHTKNEKFLVVSGQGLIQFRDVFTDEVIEYKVSGEVLEVVDIPTGYTHNIINTGDTELVTIMWANETFDPKNPDTYYEVVK